MAEHHLEGMWLGDDRRWSTPVVASHAPVRNGGRWHHRWHHTPGDPLYVHQAVRRWNEPTPER